MEGLNWIAVVVAFGISLVITAGVLVVLVWRDSSRTGKAEHPDS